MARNSDTRMSLRDNSKKEDIEVHNSEEQAMNRRAWREIIRKGKVTAKKRKGRITKTALQMSQSWKHPL